MRTAVTEENSNTFRTPHLDRPATRLVEVIFIGDGVNASDHRFIQCSIANYTLGFQHKAVDFVKPVIAIFRSLVIQNNACNRSVGPYDPLGFNSATTAVSLGHATHSCVRL